MWNYFWVSFHLFTLTFTNYSHPRNLQSISLLLEITTNYGRIYFFQIKTNITFFLFLSMKRWEKFFAVFWFLASFSLLFPVVKIKLVLLMQVEIVMSPHAWPTVLKLCEKLGVKTFEVDTLYSFNIRIEDLICTRIILEQGSR